MNKAKTVTFEQTKEDKDSQTCQEMFDRFVPTNRVLGKTYTPELHFEQWTAFKAGWRAANQDADLITAELLAALQEIVRRNEIQSWFNLDQAKAAIEKATKGV